MKKRMLSLFLVICMVLGMIPSSVFAVETGEAADDSVTVYFSISDDASYLVGDATGEVMALKEITVPYFDLANYGLEQFYFVSETYSDDGDGQPGSDLVPGTAEYAEGKVTLLHLYIYALEVYYCGVDPTEAGQGYLYDEGLLGTEVLDVGGSQGSAFLNYIWGVDMNLNYYVNYEYPLASEGWGATCDQILLRDGDIMTLGHFTGWSFYSDSTSIFNYAVPDNENPTQGDEITLTLYHAGADMSGSYTTAHTVIDYCPDVYYAPVDDIPSGDVTAWEYLGTAEADGTLVVDTAELAAGEYIIAMAGQYGVDYPDEICSTPGGLRLTVAEQAHTHSYESVVTAPTCTEGGYTTYTCACGDSYVADETDALGHSYEGGVCTVCGAADPDNASMSVTLKGLHSAQLNYLKVYTYEDGVKGETDLLAEQTTVADGYSMMYETTLVPGDYWVEGYDSNDANNGGIVITVTADGENTFTFCRAYQIKVSNSGWVLGTDYEVSAKATNPDRSVDRQAVMGEADAYGTVYPSCICLTGDTLEITYTPIGDKAGTYLETTKSATMTADSNSWSQTLASAIDLTFVVPAGSTVDVGKFSTYYIYNFYEQTGCFENEDGTLSYTFRVPQDSVNAVNGPYFFYRVQNPAGVTYWDFFAPATLTAETATITLTDEQLFIGSEEFTSDTIYHNYEKNTYDTADIYLNVNGQGYMDLDVGETFELNVFRNWMAIENFYNRRVALPDMHYEVINVDGENVISVSANEKNNSVATLTATGEGTAIVLVTYDAMYSDDAYVSGSANQPGYFSAIWPENTGVFVVTVGNDGSAIATNMTIDRNGTAGTLDAEHDHLYYLGNEGAAYSFQPESGTTVTVCRSTVSDTAMTFSGGFTAEGVTVAEDGTVTVSGLTEGRHIVKVEKDGVANYQVITAKQTSYELQDADGNALTDEQIAAIGAGDTVYVQFTGLANPCEKMSGVYNHAPAVLYVGEDGTSFVSSGTSGIGVYGFGGNPAMQKVAITIPKYWTGDSYTVGGAIRMNTSGSSAGAHRGVTYAKGQNANFTATVGSNVLSQLPDITFNLAETEFLTGKLNFVDLNGDPITAELSITMTDAEGNAVVVNEDYTFGCLAGEYSFIINGAGVQYYTGSVTVTDDGENTFNVTLTTTGEGAWDGVTVTEPAQDENGVYQISTGAELAWFSLQNQTNKANVSGKLVADIDLACYPWNNTLTYANYATVLDGNGHTITNLNATRGLFGALGANSSVTDLTIYGVVTGGSQAGSVVGYSNGNHVLIENIVNYASVSGTSTTGGIVGTAYGTLNIRNCVNHAEINTTGGNVGGIIGSTGNATITGCYNTADITGGATVGGIFGATGYAVTIIGCYNTGDISGTNNIGGVGGNLSGPSWGSGTASLSDSYSTGTVTGTNSNVGGALGYYNSSKATVSRTYYLEGVYTSDSVAVMMTSEQLKSAELDPQYFGGTCDGYPALLWQTDVNFHATETTGVVTAPTCTEKGYTTYVCDECGASYTTEYVDALGHAWCEDTTGCADCVYTAPTCTESGSIVRSCIHDGCDEIHTDVIPATGHTEDEAQTVEGLLYNDCVCSVCGESYRDWHDDRLQYMILDMDVLSDITLEDNTYPWTYNAATGRMESTNKGVGSSTSQTAVTVTLTGSATVSFNYGVSSEANYDKLTITASSDGTTIATVANAISGVSESSFSTELAAGTYTLTFAYTKDSSANGNNDLAWFSDVVIEAPHVHSYESVVTAPTCTEQGYTTYTCECGDSYVDDYTDALGHSYATGICTVCGAADPDYVAVTGVTLDQSAVELEIGGTATLVATVTPEDATDKTVTWTSSDEAVATVQDGVVTAVAAGEATITAKAGDAEAACTVTVKAAAEPFTYEITDTPSNGDTWATLGNGTISGEAGGVVEHIWDGSSLIVILTEDTPDDAVITSSFATSGLRPSISGTGDVTLVDGTATQTIKLSSPFGTVGTWTVLYTKDKAPVLSEGQAAESTGEITVNESYEIALDGVFTDPDGDALTYQVSVDGSAYEAVEGSSYSYVPTVPGEHTLVFRANDGILNSWDTYTVIVDAKNSSVTYDVTVIVPEAAAPAFYAVNEVVDGEAVKGDALVYEDGVVKVPENITRIAWEAEGVIGMSAPVSGGMTLEIVTVTYEVTLYNGDADAEAVIEIKDAEGVTVTGTAADTYLLPALAGFTYNATASGDNASKYNPGELTGQTPAAGEVTIPLNIKHFTVIAPAGSVVSAGTLAGSFSYTFADVIDVQEVDDTVVYKFAPLSGNAFIRVQNPDDDAVTYWDYKTSKADGQTITVTEEMLFMNDAGTEGEFNADTIYRNFEYYSFDLGDIYMNINNQGYIDLDVGEIKDLNMFRNWQAINSFTNDKIAIPDFEYEIVNIEGDNVISIVPDEDNTGAAVLTAEGEGTAIVLVTYDAMYSEITATGSMGGAGGANRLSAIWPDRTGVFVVSVGKDGTGINSNMTCNGAIFDAEHSPQFYHGDEGATVSFTPDEGVTVTVNRSTVGEEKLSFGEFTNEGVTVNAETGEVTVSGLTTGRHIIRLEKDGVAGYQVVTATQTTVVMTDSEGNEISLEEQLNPGQTVSITVTGLTNPAEKFATKYNFNAQITYLDQAGNTYKNSSGASYGRYDFSSVPQTITVTIPEDWAEEDLTLNGYIQMGGFAGDGIGSHRKVSYGENRGMAWGADAGMVLGTLPEIVLHVHLPEVHEHTYENGVCTGCGEADPDYVAVLASGWSGYTTWVLTEDGTLTVSPSGQTLENGQCNMRNYWKVDGVLTLPWGEYADMITTVVIEEGVHAVGQMAFYELPNLTTVILPESLDEIRNYGFKNSTALETINLENVGYIREGAFYGCAALADVTLAADVVVEDWAFTKSGVTID